MSDTVVWLRQGSVGTVGTDGMFTFLRVLHARFEATLSIPLTSLGTRLD